MTGPSTTMDDSRIASNNTTAFSPAGDSTPSTASFPEPTRDWLTIKLPRDDAVAYLQGEIHEWFHEQGIDIQARLDSQEQGAEEAKPRYIPWYLGGYEGVRIHKAVRFHMKFWRESFRSNPYGLNAKWYLFIMFSQLAFLLGNIMMGTAEAMDRYKAEEKHVWAPILRGAVAGLPIVWMFTLFLYPPLIANVKDQFTAMGHYYDE